MFQTSTDVVCDPKRSAQHWQEKNCKSAERHGFMDIQHALAARDTPTYCFLHKSCCKLEGAPHLVVAGFPCAPFSQQRVGRHLDGRCAEWGGGS